VNPTHKLEMLRKVPFLAALDDATLADVAEHASQRHYATNQHVVSELEFGCDVFVVASGQAEVSIQPQAGERQVLDRIGPGVAFGEMASLTGELRSATVRATTPLDVLVIKDSDFDALRVRRPEVAVALAHVLAERLVESENTLRLLLSGDAAASARTDALLPRSSLKALWRELVVNHQKDLAFLTLVAFVVTLIAVRTIVGLSFAFDCAPRQVLRAAYLSGFCLVMMSACASLLTFRPGWRRAICFAYGVGSALIVNELGVTLAFDIFYKDIFTPDPQVPFDIERLYRRTEPIRAAIVGLSLLVQAVYLKSFYARAWYLLRLRLRRPFR
jgi:CRP-like cAMP-binding protein